MRGRMETAVKFDKVELVFDSCETITIGLDAIRWTSKAHRKHIEGE